MWRLAGDIALARGDLAAAAGFVASIRSVTDGARYDPQYHLPLVRLETALRLAQRRPAEALSVVEDALDRYAMRESPRYAWPVLVAGARACACRPAAATRARWPRPARRRCAAACAPRRPVDRGRARAAGLPG